jgi:hypothetical protein
MLPEKYASESEKRKKEERDRGLDAITKRKKNIFYALYLLETSLYC